jgi:hypothetical protein
VARNVDVLVRGVRARVEEGELEIHCLEAPECRVGAQRILCALGMISRRVAQAGKEEALDPESVSFVPDVGHALRAVFAFFRKEMGERGLRDGVRLLGEAAMCRKVLRMLGTVPSLVPRVESEPSEGIRGSGVWERAGPVRDGCWSSPGSDLEYCRGASVLAGTGDVHRAGSVLGGDGGGAALDSGGWVRGHCLARV